MKHRLCGLVCAVALVGCGGGRMAELKVVKAKTVLAGPPATPEELNGEVPPLRGLTDTIPLVPPELIPPEPPADPAFE
jgi:hypothetical protein